MENDGGCYDDVARARRNTRETRARNCRNAVLIKKTGSGGGPRGPSLEDIVSFERLFGVSLDRFHGELMQKGLVPFDFDVIKFDDWLQTKGYSVESSGSAASFVERIYGVEAVGLILRLLGTPQKEGK